MFHMHKNLEFQYGHVIFAILWAEAVFLNYPEWSNMYNLFNSNIKVIHEDFNRWCTHSDRENIPENT